MTERQYPIYKFEVKIPVPTFAPTYTSFHFEGLEGGWQWETFSKEYMYREELLESEKIDVLAEFVNNSLEDRNRKDLKYDIDRMTSKITYKKHSTWCLTWFSHFTFDNGQTDDEVLESFTNYVRKIQQYNRSLPYQEGDRYDYKTGMISLMGAQDEWRWHGTTNGDPNNRTDAPCRCEHCKEKGILTIGH